MRAVLNLAALPMRIDSAYCLGVSDPTKPAWATAIQKRRTDDLQATQESIVAASGDTLTQADVSRMERGILNPLDLTAPKFFGMLNALEWTVEQFEDATGLEAAFLSREQAEAFEATRYLQVSPDYHAFPVYASAAAGDSNAEPIEGEMAYISKEKLRKRGADPRHVIVYRVNGDCMISKEARMQEKNIVHGDYVAVDTRRKPQPGDTVVAWWPADNKLVVKRYRVEREGIILYPLSPAAPVLVLPHEDDVNIIGVVIWREG